MYCENCGSEIPEGASFCSSCGHKIKKTHHKNIYLALVLSFILSGLGSVYAGNTQKGMIIIALRILFAALAVFVNVFMLFTMLVWAYGFYAAYQDVQIANGHSNPRLLEDFKTWGQNKQILAVLIVCTILFLTVSSCIVNLTMDPYSPSDSYSSYHTGSSSSSSSSGSSHSSSHYGGVDDSPNVIAKNDPDWYYDHYEYGDNDKIDEYLESQGYD